MCILERMGILLVAYLFTENKTDEKIKFIVKNILLLIYQNYMILAGLIYSKIIQNHEANVVLINLEVL